MKPFEKHVRLSFHTIQTELHIDETVPLSLIGIAVIPTTNIKKLFV